MSLKKQLARYKQHLSKPEEKNESVTPLPSEDQLYKTMKDVAKQLDAEFRSFEDQYILVKRETIPLDTQHGPKPFKEIYQAVTLWQKGLTSHPLSTNGLEAESLLFFDTETTGLSSGAGHMIFLLGCGVIKDNKLIITQYFLPGPGHETAFYYHFLTDIKELTNLVTFNGKAFDWPRVKTRVQFVRDAVPKLPAFGHFDLLHASRRLWKNQLESTRLSMIEEKIIGFQREGDIPGHMAPFLYFEFLKSPKSSLVEGIFRHNADDIKTLLSLYTHLSQLIHQDGIKPSRNELYEVARWHAALGEHQEAVNILKSIELEKMTQETAHLFRLKGICHKKLGNYDAAYGTFRGLIEAGIETDPYTSIECAKLAEHFYKNYKEALYYTEYALELLDKKTFIFDEKYHKDKMDIQKRHDRLQDKLKTSMGN
jgi:uncharacterized protein